MKLDMALNELSFKDLAESVFDARARMQTFAQVVNGAVDIAGEGLIHTKGDFFEELLAPDYRLGNWLNDPAAERDIQGYIRSVLSKGPFLERILGDSRDVEVQYEEEQAYGLSAAYLFDWLAISMGSHAKWDRPYLDVTRFLLLENGDLEESPVSVKHASKLDHILTHKQWMESYALDSVKDGIGLWAQKDELFPSLIFSEQIESQIKDMNRNHAHFETLCKRLRDFQHYCGTWDGKGINLVDLLFPISRESKATMQKYGDRRRFQCEGGTQVFQLHTRLSRAIRLYFIPDADRRRILIGYIGPHLATVSDPT